MIYQSIKFYPIQGYDKRYLVSKCGKVLSVARNKPLILKQDTDKDGYKKVRLYSVFKKSKKFSVHRLVAKTFLGNSTMCVNHKNGIKDDNRLSNLEYCTIAQNNNHARSVLKSFDVAKISGENHYSARLNKETVWKILDDPCSIIEAEKKYSYDRRNVHRIRKGKIWRAVYNEYIAKNKQLPKYKNSKISSNP